MPLQIFEQRYLDLVKESMRSGEGFGIVRIERGAEVADDDLPDARAGGHVARIVDWDQLDNGLLGITVAGRQRFRLQRHWRGVRSRILCRGGTAARAGGGADARGLGSAWQICCGASRHTRTCSASAWISTSTTPGRSPTRCCSCCRSRSPSSRRCWRRTTLRAHARAGQRARISGEASREIPAKRGASTRRARLRASLPAPASD
jgi:hypothetical protein